MRKLFILFTFLSVSLMGFATQYCHEALTLNGGATIYLSCTSPSAGNYQIVIEGENLNGLGGSFFNPGAVDLRTKITSSTSTRIVCDIAAASAPSLYTPLYVMCPGEQNIGWPNDVEWGECAGGGGDPDPGTDPGDTPVPDPNDYTSGGHTIHLDASYVGDIYTLVITSADDMQGLGGSFWNVNGVGTDMRSNDATKSYTVSGDKKTITCQVQSSSAPNIYTPLYVLMPGEVVFNSVTLNWEDRTPINSEYCNYQGSETQQEGHYYAITWETDPSGNVVITIGNGTGAGACSFRNGGFEGGDNGLANFVISDDNFATTTPATDYFTVTRPSDGDLEYVMTKIADLPANAKIKHLSAGAIAWREAGADRWCYPEFIYTYGGTCNQLDAPTNVAIDGTNHITFDAVAGADSYTALVSLGGVQKYSQVVASGDELTYVPLVTGDYTVNVVASGTGKVDSDPSADVVWHLEAAPIVLGNSEYCEANMSSGNTLAAFTWETDASGNIVITISEALGGAADATHFRATGLALANFKVGSAKTEASVYFNHSGETTGNQITLSLKDPAVAPGLGEKIYYNAVVTYATSLDGNAWPTLNFEYTYGTECSGIAVSATPNDNTMGTAVVQKAGVDVDNVEDGDEVTFIATSNDAELYRFVNWTKAGSVVSSNATYVTTITETTNLVANFEYIRNVYCHSEINSIQNKKLYLTLGSIGGGKYQIKFEGSAEAQLTGLNNANYTINWVTTDIADGDKKMSGQDVPFNNARWTFDASGYGSATATFGIAEGHTWEDIYAWNHAIYFSTAAGEVGYTGFPGRNNIDWTATCADAEAPVFTKAEAEVLNESSVRLKIQATDNWEGMLTYTIARAGEDPIISNHASGEEFAQEVTGLTAGTEYDFTVTVSDGVNNTNTHILVTPVADETKPVMGAASLESKTWNSAIINVAATDDKGVVAYHIVELDADFAPAEDKITVEGLTAATAYTFTIKAKDAAGNISDNSAEVSFITDAHALVPQAACPAPTWPADQVEALYSPTYNADYNHQDWNSGTVATKDEFGRKYVVPASGYFGADGFSLNCINMEKLHYDIWIADNATLRIVPICRNTADTGNEPEVGVTVNLTGQQWNSIDLTLATDYSAVTNWSNVYQVKIDYAANLTFWVGNAFFYRTSPLEDNEAPANVTASVASQSYYSVVLEVSATDNKGALNYIVKNGDVQVATGSGASGATINIPVSNLTPATNYTFDVIAKDANENAAAPVAVAASTLALPAAAPTPNVTGKTVVPVFSDEIAGSLATIHLPWWEQATIAQFIDLTSSDKLFYCRNFNYQGWDEFSIDATGMEFLHVDVFTPAMTSIGITPISPGKEKSTAQDLTPNTWTSLDIPLSVYASANIDWTNIYQFKFDQGTGGEFFIDNVYFWAEAPAPEWVEVRTGLEINRHYTVCLEKNVTDIDGATFWSLDKRNQAGTMAYLEEEPAPEAGKPYIIQATKDVLKVVYGNETAATPVANGALRGTFENLAASDLNAINVAPNEVYMLFNNELRPIGSDNHLDAHRAYVLYNELQAVSADPVPAPGRRVKGMPLQRDAATGIDELNASEAPVKMVIDGQFFILRGEKLYDATGRLVK